MMEVHNWGTRNQRADGPARDRAAAHAQATSARKLDVCHDGWWSADTHMNAGPKTEQVEVLRDNIICVEFKGIREAKEHACERR
ncbi:hypothetical protein AOQ72_16265 [Bradyrhizobium yuanmingense]|uniref:Uncharacterized protein n=1 Tax=Bradyrhizobium yuanmingense TaxID=108015 RepID=A0A0R3CUM2_9BRAD|nr:hypothetical protein AOQ72_16265 [Bradyrhizobium yuanmingense]